MNNIEKQPESKQKYILVVMNRSKGIESRIELEEGKVYSVGADIESSIYIEGDQFISFRHFSLKLQDGKIEVTDLNSKNGLYLLLGKEPTEIQAGETLLVGKTLFRLETEDADDKSLPTTEQQD